MPEHNSTHHLEMIRSHDHEPLAVARDDRDNGALAVRPARHSSDAGLSAWRRRMFRAYVRCRWLLRRLRH